LQGLPEPEPWYPDDVLPPRLRRGRPVPAAVPEDAAARRARKIRVPLGTRVDCPPCREAEARRATAGGDAAPG
jgi:hypothetical protein